jgi:hypothetical protein
VRTASIIGAMMMETEHTSETSVCFNEIAWLYIPEGCHLRDDLCLCCESYKIHKYQMQHQLLLKKVEAYIWLSTGFKGLNLQSRFPTTHTRDIRPFCSKPFNPSTRLRLRARTHAHTHTHTHYQQRLMGFYRGGASVNISTHAFG